MERIKEEILKNLRTDHSITAAALAEKTAAGEKTVRLRLKELGEELKQHGAKLIAKPRVGYSLYIENAEKYETWKKNECENQELFPSTSEERIQFLLVYLLNHSDYIKMEELCEFLYVSRNTISADMKRVEYILGVYNLKVHRRPNYGICVEGKEFDRRLCLVNSLLKQEFIQLRTQRQQEEEQIIAEILRKNLRKYQMKMDENAFENLCMYLYITMGRLRRGHLVRIEQKMRETMTELVGSATIKTAAQIAKEIEDYSGLRYRGGEICYLAIQISGRSMADSDGGKNFVISEKTDELVLEMLSAVYEGVGLNFTDNLELRMSLNQHMVPFDIRMRYGIPIKNPLLSQIKAEYPFAYTVAAMACTVLKDVYGKKISEDETGYFAAIFALAIEKQDKEVKKKNIVVVCVSGRGSSRLFLHRYQQAFGKYIDQIYECTVYDLRQFDFKGRSIDYVFTTVPINEKLPVPVFEVSAFPRKSELDKYRKIFEKKNYTFLNRLFTSDMFVERLEKADKEQVLSWMCQYAAERKKLPADFYEAVCKREKMGQTDFGNLVAIPHPYKMLPGDSFVMTAVLKRPIWWGHNDVQVVMLIFLPEETDADIEEFYHVVTGFLADAEAVKRVIQKPGFSTLMTELIRDKQGE